jgi:hypothetical protein
VLEGGATEIRATSVSQGEIDVTYPCSNGSSLGPQKPATFGTAGGIITVWTCPQGQAESEPAGPCLPIPNNLGYYNANPSNLAPQGGSCDGSVSQTGCAQTSEPINPGNGNESLTEPDDYRSADGRLKFSRVYNSLNAQGSIQSSPIGMAIQRCMSMTFRVLKLPV